MSHDEGEACECVATHTPAVTEHVFHHVHPLGMGGPDIPGNIVALCPTTHYNVHELLRAWVDVDGEPPWEVRRAVNPYVRALAEDGYRRWVAAGRPGRP